MIGFSQYLVEFAGEFNIAKKAYEELSSDAQYALSTWEHNDWKEDGRLSTHAKKNDAIWKEILDKGQLIRAAIEQREGKTLTLYRGFASSELDNTKVGNRELFSWTARKKIADVFATRAKTNYKNKKIVYPSAATFPHEKAIIGIDRKRIPEYVARFERTGYLSIGDLRFMRFKDDKRWMNVYYKRGGGETRELEYGTDADIRKYIERTLDDIERNKPTSTPGVVVEKKIPVKDIVWVLTGNGLGTMEYIVRGHSGVDGKRV